jgi:hypothetical protein
LVIIAFATALATVAVAVLDAEAGIFTINLAGCEA